MIGIVQMQATVFAASAPPAYPELVKLQNFLNFIIGLIRWGAGGVVSLVVAVTGWQILTSNNGGRTEGLEIAKKKFKDAVWALILIFSCTWVGNFIVNKFASLLM
jgi:hypothetical protein